MAEIKEMAEKIRQAERGETPDDAAGRAKAAKEKQERRGMADKICKRIGNRTFEYTNRPCIIGAGSVAGEMEGQGPQAKWFDMILQDDSMGEETWEKSESKMFRTAVDSVSPGEVEAARTLGYSRRQAFFRVVFPQALHQVMPLYKTQFVLTMQDTSVVSLLAIEDMSRAVTVISSRTMDPVVALVITSIVYLLLGFIANRMLSLADRSKHLYSGEAAQWQ